MCLSLLAWLFTSTLDKKRENMNFAVRWEAMDLFADLVSLSGHHQLASLFNLELIIAFQHTQNGWGGKQKLWCWRRKWRRRKWRRDCVWGEETVATGREWFKWMICSLKHAERVGNSHRGWSTKRVCLDGQVLVLASSLSTSLIRCWWWTCSICRRNRSVQTMLVSYEMCSLYVNGNW